MNLILTNPPAKKVHPAGIQNNDILNTNDVFAHPAKKIDPLPVLSKVEWASSPGAAPLA